jgi:hypothetical protein
MDIKAPPGELIPVARAINFGVQTVIYGQSSRDVIIAAGAALATANNNPRASRSNRSVSRTALVTQEAAYAEVPRALPSWNKQWLNVVLTFAKDRMYDGISLVPQTHDQKHRYQAYKYNVGAAIKLCQGPKHNQASVSLVEDQCAILLCDGSALS